MTTAPANPYIGPRPFQEDEERRFFGRERFVEDLYHLLIGRRLVLLHAPSGAGKSSLINAALIPRLRREGFFVHPVIRVGAEPDPNVQANRYVYATLRALDPARRRAEAWSTLTLAAFAETATPESPSATDEDAEEVYIFDQFEEVLTADPTDQAAKAAFFAQLGELLNNPRRWALFALREDQLGALRPLLWPIPTRLAAMRRLDLLNPDEAARAITEPAALQGVTFTEAATARLVDDLRSTLIQQADGRTSPALGPVIEPVQLQVVCERLWADLFSDPERPTRASIDVGDLQAFGDVNNALTAYYAQRMQSVATVTTIDERTIRNWFDTQLITPNGRRSQVLQQAGQSAGLDNTAISALINAHLVRADERNGSIWYELAHDRLIEPIRADNAAWRKANLNAFQEQAALWAAQQRPDGLLLQGQALYDAEAWVNANRDRLTDDERAFYAKCRQEFADREREQRQSRLIAALGLAALIAFIVTFVLLRQDQIQARNTLIRQLAAEARLQPEQSPRRSILLAAEAARRVQPGDPAANEAEASLRVVLSSVGSLPLWEHAASVRGVAYSPDGRRLASVADDTNLRLWPLDALDAPPDLRTGHSHPIRVLAFSDDSARIATGSEDKTVRVWSVADPAEPPLVLHGHGLAVAAVAFSPDNRLLISGGDDGTVLRWALDQPALAPTPLTGHATGIVLISFSPDGSAFATLSNDGRALIWDTADPQQAPVAIDAVAWLTFTPDSRRLAVAARSGEIYLITTDRPLPDAVEPPMLFGVQRIAVSPQGDQIAIAAGDGTVQVWGLMDGGMVLLNAFRGASGIIHTLQFSPDGSYLATAANTRIAAIWHLASAAEQRLIGHEAAIEDLAFSADGAQVATASLDGTVRLWAIGQSTIEPRVLPQRPALAITFALSPAGGSLAFGTSDGAVKLIDLTVEAGAPRDLPGTADYLASVEALDYSSDGRLLARSGRGNEVLVWDVTRPDAAPQVLEGHTDWVPQLAFIPGGERLATAGWDMAIRLWDLSTDPPTAIVLPTAHTDQILALAVSPDGQWLASGGGDGRIILWSAADPTRPHLELKGGSGRVLKLAFSPDSRWLATARESSPAFIFPVGSEEGVEVTAAATTAGGVSFSSDAERRGPDHVTSLAFSPDNAWLATGSVDGRVELWQLNQPQFPEPLVLAELPNFGATSGAIGPIAFDRSGALIAAGVFDGGILLWRAVADPAADSPRWAPELVERQPVTLAGHTDLIMALAFTADGDRLYSASSDQTIRIWQTQLAAIQRRACEIAGRNFTTLEWQTLIVEEGTAARAEWSTLLPQRAEAYTPTCPAIARHESYYTGLIDQGQIDEALDQYAADQPAGRPAESPAAWLVRVAGAVMDNRPDNPALEAYARALALDPDLVGVSARTLQRYCIYGNPGNARRIFDACDRSVALNEADGNFRYNRARVRAMLGDVSGAIEDFEVFKGWAPLHPGAADAIARVDRWIEQLQRGESPFGLATP